MDTVRRTAGWLLAMGLGFATLAAWSQGLVPRVPSSAGSIAPLSVASDSAAPASAPPSLGEQAASNQQQAQALIAQGVKDFARSAVCLGEMAPESRDAFAAARALPPAPPPTSGAGAVPDGDECEELLADPQLRQAYLTIIQARMGYVTHIESEPSLMAFYERRLRVSEVELRQMIDPDGQLAPKPQPALRPESVAAQNKAATRHSTRCRRDSSVRRKSLTSSSR